MESLQVSTSWGKKRLGLFVENLENNERYDIDPGQLLSGSSESIIAQEGPRPVSGFLQKLCVARIDGLQMRKGQSGIFVVKSVDGKRRLTWPVEEIPEVGLKITLAEQRFRILQTIIDPHRSLYR